MALTGTQAYVLAKNKIKSSSSGINKVEVDKDNHLIITFIDGTFQDAGELTSKIKTKEVATLPTSNIDSSIIYLVPCKNGDGEDILDEYIYINGKWERLGSRDTAVEMFNSSIADDSDIIDIV